MTFLEKCARRITSSIKNSIIERLIPQELAPATIRRRAGGKGQSDPTALYDTGQLVNSITWAVESKKA